MGKLVVKTAAITLACILAVALLLFGVFSLFFPSVMMELTDRMGMDGACASYSIAQYKKSKKVDDLAIAVERSYHAEHFEDAAVYGKIFLDSEEFSEYCGRLDAGMSSSEQEMLGDSAQYYAGITAVSQYYIHSELSIDTAFNALNDSFPAENAVVFLSFAAMGKEDKPFCVLILERLDKLRVPEEDTEYFAEFQTFLSGFCS